MSGELSVEDLYDLSDDKLISIIKESLVSQLKNSSSVKPVFFPNASSPQIPVPDDATPMNCIGSITQIDWVATALVCSSLARTSLYGFNQTVDLAKSDALWGDWFKNQSPIYTRNLYFSYFDRYCQNSSGTTFFSDYLHDSPGLWSQKLAEHVTTNEFINETIAKLIASEPNWLVKINLILYKLYRLDPAQKNIVLAKWQSAYSNIQEIWSTYDYVGDAFITATLFFQDVQAAVAVATDHESSAPMIDPGAFYIPTDETTYGVAVVGFLNGSPNSLGLYTHANPNNYIRSGGASCFVGSTSIRLSDMQSKAIKSVTSGDWVLTANHQVAMVSDERVMTRFKKPILIYGFNNVRPFFTAGHCFWTDGGWKAVDPAIALQENHQLVVSRLAVGDHVLKLTADIGQSTKHQQWVKIRSLNQAILPAGYPVYGLHLVDGHHSYYANDFLVRMNYPILTEAKFSHGFSLLSASERQFVHQQLRPIMPLLKKSLGEHIEQPLLRAITQQGSDFHHDNLSDHDLFRKSKDTLYHLYVLDLNTCLYTSRHNLAKELRISHGNVFYDGMHIKNVLFDHESIRWSEQHGDRYSSAVLFYRDADLSLSGTLFYGPTSSKAIAHEVFLGIPPSIYTTKISKKSVSVLPDNLDIQSDGPFEQGPSFSLGFVEPDVSKNSQIPTIEFKLKTELNSDWADLSNFVLFSTNPKTNNLVISFDPKYPDFYSLITEGVNQYGETFPGAGRLEFSWDACCLSGYFCPAYTTNIFSYWAGNLVPSLSPDFAVGIEFSNFTIATGELELSVADLFTLSADQTNLQKTSNDFLIENMKWHLGKYHPDYLTNFFGEIQPLIPDDRISEISQSYDFYEDFANAYVCNGVGSFASSPLNGDEQSRLKNFFENGLAKNTSYSIQSRCLLKHSYMRNIPRISDYLLDGGEKWARLLFNELMTQQSINRFVTQIIASNNFDVCNKYATLLNILDPKSQLDAEFIQILNGFVA